MIKADFGGINSATGGKLSCNFSPGQECAWRNAEGAPLQWRRATFESLTKRKFQQITKQRVLPNGNFLVTNAIDYTPPSSRAILTAKIPCQKNEATLEFKYWMSSKHQRLAACVVSLVWKEEKQCVGNIDRERSNVVTLFIMPPPEGGPFQITIEAYGFEDAGFVIIDDIEYAGNICRYDPVRSGNTGQLPHNASSDSTTMSTGCQDVLSCDFESGSECSYQVLSDAKTGTESWKIGQGRVGNALTGIPGDSRGVAAGKFAYVGYQSPDTSLLTPVDYSSTVFVMQSPTFTLRRPASLHYDVFVRSAFPELRICVDNVNTCLKSYRLRDIYSKSEKWWRRNEAVILPPGNHRVLFVARNVSGNQYVAVDNITIEPHSALC